MIDLYKDKTKNISSHKINNWNSDKLKKKLPLVHGGTNAVSHLKLFLKKVPFYKATMARDRVFRHKKKSFNRAGAAEAVLQTYM